MFRKLTFIIALTSMLAVSIPAQQTLTYPKPKKVDQVDDYHGTKVPDPYRWMENTGSADTQAWIEDQNKLTAS